ncbi:Hpt domain-containing protein [Occallatibacter riparius]|uniref:Hpt domain-containing protein n=1 Tax=Occallatibacter riparius TaxID=1002689 RepID=A0A9J7BNI4_9BACT|nr:Hpt domain-containing protein [Occallatibacter riparius]UWZ83306.1 Hpt domain-containing protein [Occallatibacter riparius]
MGTGPQPQIAEALKLLWLKFLPQMQERVAVLEGASSALQAGALSDGQRSAAGAAAHKLAGVLGTFGLTEGTSLAREAEQMFTADDLLDSAAAVRIAAITNQLADLIRTHR